MAVHDVKPSSLLTTACGSALLMLAFVAPLAEAANIYRYVDASGRTVFNSMIPPEYVRNGYTVLNEQGQVVEVVPPAPTAQEIAAREAQALARQAEEEALREQMEADNLLLRLYRSPEEISRKRDERLQQLDAQIAGLNVTIQKLDDEILRLEQAVENARANQLEPAATVLDSLSSKTAERERFTTQRDAVLIDKDKVASDAERDIARLRELLDSPE
jgi:hypothetical protein